MADILVRRPVSPDRLSVNSQKSFEQVSTVSFVDEDLTTLKRYSFITFARCLMNIFPFLANWKQA